MYKQPITNPVQGLYCKLRTVSFFLLIYSPLSAKQAGYKATGND